MILVCKHPCDLPSEFRSLVSLPAARRRTMHRPHAAPEKVGEPAGQFVVAEGVDRIGMIRRINFDPIDELR